MHILFVHQNYPAQFRYLAPRLVADFGWRCTFATRNTKAPDVPGVERVVYRLRSGPTRLNHFCTRSLESGVAHAHAAYEALKARPDVQPDLIVAHSGFGSSLFLPHLYDEWKKGISTLSLMNGMEKGDKYIILNEWNGKRG